MSGGAILNREINDARRPRAARDNEFSDGNGELEAARTGIAWIDVENTVAIVNRRDRRKFIRDLRVADVASVDDEIAALQKRLCFGAQEAMCVGDEAYAKHAGRREWNDFMDRLRRQQSTSREFA